MFLFALRPDRRKADGRHPGGQEPEEDGRRGPERPLRQDSAYDERYASI